MSVTSSCKHLSRLISKRSILRRLFFSPCMIPMSGTRSLQYHCTRQTPFLLILPGSRDCSCFLIYLMKTLLTTEHEAPYVRETAAKALATALPALPDHFTDYLDKLMQLY